jgi:hypothetical protein
MPNRLSYIAIAEAFFARHLGGACEPVGRDFDGSGHEVRAGADILLEIGLGSCPHRPSDHVQVCPSVHYLGRDVDRTTSLSVRSARPASSRKNVYQ